MTDIVYFDSHPEVQKNTHALFDILDEYFSHQLSKAQDEEMKSLLSKPLDLKAYETDSGYTLLIYAARCGCIPAVRALVENGADMEQKSRNHTEYTALFAAIIANRPKTALWLIDAGADVHTRSPKFDTLLAHAAKIDAIAVTKQLLAGGVNANDFNKSGHNAFHSALSFGKWEHLQAYIDAGADIEAVTQPSGATPLVTAIRLSKPEGITVLLAGGASIYATGEIGMSAAKAIDAYAALTGTSISTCLTDIEEHKRIWDQKLEAFAAGTYTPSTRGDWNRLASVMPLEDPKHPPSVAARIRILEEMRPDICLGAMREKAQRTHAKGAEL